MSENPEQTPQRPAKDPMKGFRGVMAGALVMEAITLGLALPVINKLGDGLDSLAAWLVGGIALLMIVLCGFLRRPGVTTVILGLQVVLIAFFVLEPAVGVIGVIFLLAWLCLFWMRAQVAKRMAAGTLPSQQGG